MDRGREVSRQIYILDLKADSKESSPIRNKADATDRKGAGGRVILGAVSGIDRPEADIRHRQKRRVLDAQRRGPPLHNHYIGFRPIPACVRTECSLKRKRRRSQTRSPIRGVKVLRVLPKKKEQTFQGRDDTFKVGIPYRERGSCA